MSFERSIDISGRLNEQFEGSDESITELLLSLSRRSFEAMFSRGTNCGLAAELSRRLLRQNGISATLICRTPIELSPEFERYRGMISARHVVCLVDASQEPTVVDGNYSQFLAPFGIDAHMERFEDVSGVNHFPQERVLVFPISEVGSAARWLADYVHHYYTQSGFPMAYQRRHGYTSDEIYPQRNHPQLGAFYFQNQRPRREFTRSDMVAFFEDIWDFEKYEPFEPGRAVMELADKVMDTAIIDTSGHTL